jgi:AhpD family alkylhydroperoxidase
MESLLKRNAEIHKYKQMVGQAVPIIQTTHDAYRDGVFSDGALSTKMKRLVGVGIAVTSGSFCCLVNQTRFAVEHGASKEEIMEAVAAAIAMGGTGKIEYGGTVVKVLEELGKW